MATIETTPSRTNVVTTGVQTATTALLANASRVAWFIQNQGTNVLRVKLGAGAAAGDYSYTLAGGTGAANGTGGSTGQSSGAVYTGVITIDGTAPSYTVVQLTQQD